MINNLKKIKESFNFYLDKCENTTILELKRIKQFKDSQKKFLDIKKSIKEQFKYKDEDEEEIVNKI